MFLVAALQYVKIGDLTTIGRSSGAVAAGEGMGDVIMSDDGERLPAGVDDLSRDEERALVRESTAGFSDWVASFFRRVFALYENLPEEGGRRNTTVCYVLTETLLPVTDIHTGRQTRRSRPESPQERSQHYLPPPLRLPLRFRPQPYIRLRNIQC